MHLKGVQRYLLFSHEAAFRAVLGSLDKEPARICVVGGGIFPRTVLVLRRIFPCAELVVIDLNQRSLEKALAHLKDIKEDGEVQFVLDRFESERHREFDLVIIPLAFQGNRDALYEQFPEVTVLVHDWLWHLRGNASAIVSIPLLKRVNLVRGIRAS